MLVVALFTACSGGGEPAPPWGLDGVEQPADRAAIERVLAAMPASIAGMERVTSSEPLGVAYGRERDATLRAMELGEAAAAEGFPSTAGAFLQGLAEGGEIEIEARALDPDDDVVYVVGIVTEISGPSGEDSRETDRYVIGWGKPDSAWMFTAGGRSPQERIALVEAFVEAVRSVP